ncbi:MAG TPA: chromosome partitioning protein, partial [Actinotalea sp.]
PTHASTDPWDQAVDWSLHRELPAHLPPEPDVDDVRWDQAETVQLPAIPPPDDEDDEDEEATGPDDVAEGDGESAADATAPAQQLTGPDSTEEAGWSPEAHQPSPFDEPSGPEEPSDTDRPAVVRQSALPRPFTPVFATEPRTAPPLRQPAVTGSGRADAVPAQPDRSMGGDAAATRAPAPPFATPGAAAPVPADDFDALVSPPADAVPHAASYAARPAPQPQPPAELPTLGDLLAARPAPPAGPAEQGWQGTVRRLTGGLISPAPGPTEQRHREAVAVVQRSLEGPKTIVVINPKGGAHKTTATLLLAATFGQQRGGYTLAWDNNETRGTLGWRSHQSRHHNTAVNLLQDLDRFSDPAAARVGDLDNYVRSQGSAQFDVLASDEDAASAASIDAFAFRSLHRTLSRFYRIMVVDTGNNMRASNWQAAIDAADQVVLVSTVREDTAQSAAWAVDALRATGRGELVRNAVTVLSAPAVNRDEPLARRLHEHFGQLTRRVVEVPYEPSLVAGRPIQFDALSARTREAWLHVTAAVAEGL